MNKIYFFLLTSVCMVLLLTCSSLHPKRVYFDGRKGQPVIEFKLVDPKCRPGSREFSLKGDKNVRHCLEETVRFNQDDIRFIEQRESRWGNILLHITCTPQGAVKIRDLTRDHQQEYLALLIDGVLIITAQIWGVISNGEISIGTDFTEGELDWFF